MSSNSKVIVYSMKNCAYCNKAKQLLTEKGVPFKEEMLAEEDEAKWDELFKRSGLRTMPQIFNGDQLIGGYSDLAELDKKDGLKSLK